MHLIVAIKKRGNNILDVKNATNIKERFSKIMKNSLEFSVYLYRQKFGSYIAKNLLLNFEPSVISLIKNGKTQDGSVTFLTKKRIKQILEHNTDITIQNLFFPSDDFIYEYLKQIVTELYLNNQFKYDPIQKKFRDSVQEYLAKHYVDSLCHEAKIAQFYFDKSEDIINSFKTLTNDIDDSYDSKKVEEKIIKEFISYYLHSI
ncbi:hypothetical protein ACEE59_08985 [Streptococcus hyovaginalis]